VRPESLFLSEKEDKCSSLFGNTNYLLVMGAANLIMFYFHDPTSFHISLLLKLQKENKNIGGADNDSLAAHAALVCAAFLIIDDEVKECLLHLLKKGSEDLQSWVGVFPNIVGMILSNLVKVSI